MASAIADDNNEGPGGPSESHPGSEVLKCGEANVQRRNTPNINGRTELAAPWTKVTMPEPIPGCATRPPNKCLENFGARALWTLPLFVDRTKIGNNSNISETVPCKLFSDSKQILYIHSYQCVESLTELLTVKI